MSRAERRHAAIELTGIAMVVCTIPALLAHGNGDTTLFWAFALPGIAFGLVNIALHRGWSA